MNFGVWIREARAMFGRVVNLALIPVRLPGALLDFAIKELTRYEQERAYDRHIVKRGFAPPPEGSPLVTDTTEN